MLNLCTISRVRMSDVRIHDFVMTIHVQNWQYSCISEGYIVNTIAFLNVRKNTYCNVVHTRVKVHFIVEAVKHSQSDILITF